MYSTPEPAWISAWATLVQPTGELLRCEYLFPLDPTIRARCDRVGQEPVPWRWDGWMRRFHQCILIGSFLPLCWLGMMAVHEFGHVAAAWATGGTVTKVVLHPLAISRTDVEPNPQPLLVVWGGPLLGVLLPLAAWGVARGLGRRPYLFQFFAGFCLVANGLYLAVGAFEGVGDAGEMTRRGSPVWVLWAFGAVATPLGFLLWNRLGEDFGLGPAKGKVDKRDAYVTLALCIAAIVCGSLFSPSF